MPQPTLLVVSPFETSRLQALQPHYQITHWRELADAAAWAAQHGASVRVILTNGMLGVPAALQPHLQGPGLIACNGVGYDAIDTDWARSRGFAVSNTPDVLSEDVADLALALLLGVLRQLPAADRHVRSGTWAQQGPLPLGRRLGGRRIGIVGLGRIGERIAQRCLAFDTEVAYHSRRPRLESPLPYQAELLALAQWADVLIAATPGGADTRHLIDAAVLDALGPDGILINVARGSVVDEAALIAALQDGRLASAGLDVFANEPAVDAALLALPQVVLAPHIGSATRETRAAMAELVVANIIAFTEQRPLPSAVP